MKPIAYCSPFVPPEWIAAHGMRPSWLRLRRVEARLVAGLRRGVCPFAGSLVDAVLSETEALAIVLTTSCDQMRYAAALAGRRGRLPLFLMNVPSTWQTAAARRLYLDELGRLGRFLVGLGGKSPSADELARVMLAWDRARCEVRAARTRLAPRRFAEAIAELRGGGSPMQANVDSSPRSGAALALVGGPLPEEDFEILDLVEQAGGRVVLDATEGGERTLPPPFDVKRTRDDPLGELADAYFRRIPDVFRRPNDPLYQWLQRELAARQVQGILFRRYLWCDLWHAELPRLKRLSPLPVLELDVAGDEGTSRSRTLSRLEAFVEMLR
jgi:benzoyl-CoA reductase/2-hydroxyglutaryl-CoA dehydratase subunit BcrC/BadD/HgdB